MKKIGKINEEVIKRNKEYINLAKKQGFFAHELVPNEIFSCEDCHVIWWIDELGNYKNDKQRFVSEVLPTFKRWSNKGISSTGIGHYYQTLIKAEIVGIEITKDSFECIISLVKADSQINQDLESYEAQRDHFEIREVLNNLKLLSDLGLPLCLQLAHNYVLLMKLYNKGEKIDKKTFGFFMTSLSDDRSKMEYYYSKKSIEEEFGYSPSNTDEIDRLLPWINFGYNRGLVSEYEKEIEKLRKELSNKKPLNVVLKDSKIGQESEVTIEFYNISPDGKLAKQTVYGLFKSCNKDSITISTKNPQTGERYDFTIKQDELKVVTTKHHSFNFEEYKKKVRINYLTSLIEKIKSSKQLDKYIKKYGTIAGIAYLHYGVKMFIENVDKDKYPINNLFTFCFNEICRYSMDISHLSIEDVLKAILDIYRVIVNEEDEAYAEAIKASNNGFPIEEYLTTKSMNIISKMCLYSLSSDSYSHKSEENNTGKERVRKEENNEKL